MTPFRELFQSLGFCLLVLLFVTICAVLADEPAPVTELVTAETQAV